MAWYAIALIATTVGMGVVGDSGGKSYATLDECTSSLPKFAVVASMTFRQQFPDKEVTKSSFFCGEKPAKEIAEELQQEMKKKLGHSI